MTSTDGITAREAWRIAISDILDVTALAIGRLDQPTRDTLSQALRDEAADYHDADDLAQRARAALDHINSIN